MAEGANSPDEMAFRARLRKDFARPAYDRQVVNRRSFVSQDIIVSPGRPVGAGANANARTLTPVPAQALQIAVPKRRPEKADAIRRAANNHNHRAAKNSKSYNKRHLEVTALAAAIIFVGAYLSFVGWRSNHIAQVQAAKLTQQANQGASNAAPSTVKPSAKEVANYVVAPNLPRYLIIPRVGVDARVLQVGITKDGALATPSNVFDTAWYNESAQPGQPGAMLIDGHVSSWTSHGVFYGLNKLTAGDVVKVQKGDGTVLSYKVVKSQVYSASDVDMKAVMTPVTEGKPGLNLITCAGDVIRGTSEFNKRVVVFTEQE